MNVFVPTPAESHALLDVYVLANGLHTRSLDIVAVFLIGADRGGRQEYVQAPTKWYELFEAWPYHRVGGRPGKVSLKVQRCAVASGRAGVERRDPCIAISLKRPGPHPPYR